MDNTNSTPKYNKISTFSNPHLGRENTSGAFPIVSGLKYRQLQYQKLCVDISICRHPQRVALYETVRYNIGLNAKSGKTIELDTM